MKRNSIATWLGGLIAALTLSVLTLPIAVEAADKGGAKAGSAIAQPAAKPTDLEPGRPSFLLAGDTAPAVTGSWSGVGIGAYGSWINADTDTVPSLGLTGQTAGISVTGTLQVGSLVFEGFGEYGWFFGDLKDLGVDTEVAAGVRAGFLANDSAYLYAVGARSWLDTDAGNVDGWQYGAGAQFRLGASQWFGRIEYRHGEYDTAGILGVDAVTDTVRADLTYKFGGAK